MTGRVKIIAFVIVTALIFTVSLGATAENQLAGADQAPFFAPIGTAFTYQGYIEDLGTPANGSYNLSFSLWDDPTGGSQVSFTETKTGVSVVDGLFTVVLNFGTVFDGTPMWLEIEVQGPGDPDYTTLSPRQALTSMPYAYFAYSSAWSGLTGVPADFVDGVDNDTTYSAGDGLSLVGTQFHAVFGGSGAATTAARSDHDHFAQSFTGSSSSRGLYIENSGTGNGIWGQSHTNGGIGVEGYAGNSGFARGVYGSSGSSGGYGVYGFTLAGDGVGGESQAVDGRGVYGNAYIPAGTGVNYGIYGYSNSTDGYGGFFVNSSASGYLLAANDSSSTSELEFKVSNDGDVYADGQISGASFAVGSADFAEMVIPGDQALEPGDVLVIGIDGKIVRSNQTYQSTVVGVYSTSPGILAGVDLDEDGFQQDSIEIPLAIVGIVPVKASIENGTIQPGDLLVSSSLPGHAMTAGDTPPIGTVLGKALEALDEDNGMIQMLVMLQ